MEADTFKFLKLDLENQPPINSTQKLKIKQYENTFRNFYYNLAAIAYGGDFFERGTMGRSCHKLRSRNK